ncbi:MAG TPA: ATP-binding protein [Pyrinomonadaceae bacterium]|jgi:hypothetical protein|nr:ATP-binding protein [Pyrinomonadaceae bacterium]
MNDLDRWHKGNEEYLAAALHWLRLRLLRQGGQEKPALILNTSAPEPSHAAAPKRRFHWRQQPSPSTTGPTTSPPLQLPPAQLDLVTDEMVAEAASAMAAAEAVEPPPALLILAQRFGLSRFERDVLFLCAAIELDTRLAVLCARAHDDPNQFYPTFALALSLFDEPTWDALSPERPLRHWRLIEINQPGAQALTSSALRADERIVSFIKGLNYLDDRLTPLFVPLDVNADQPLLPPSQAGTVETILQNLDQAAMVQRPPVIHLLGPDVPSKQLVAWHAAASLNLHLYRLPVELLPTQATELETLTRLWQRESILLPVALYLDAHEAEKSSQGEGGQPPPLNRFLTRSSGILFLDTREVWPSLSRRAITLDISKPTPLEQQAAWANALGEEAGEIPARLTGQFNLDLMSIGQLARQALSVAASDEESLGERLWDACLIRTRPQLDNLAQRLEPKASWDDLVLPPTEKNLLRQIADQVGQRGRVYEEWGFARKMNRGLGINALFTGESGTGKTMAAEVIANDLRLNLYRIDLSAVVSKYIGETEKNLRRLFDAAEDGGAILFFDEADALFGKRSEVKDSHDRYANIEINYLLQRIEAYRGLAILATNMKSALDTAFMRRLRFVLDFPFPGVTERKAIWRGVFPPEMETRSLNFDRLARLNVTGGNIQNIALNASFLAAGAGVPLSMSLIMEAARAEFRKLGRPISEADFRWQEPVGEVA